MLKYFFNIVICFLPLNVVAIAPEKTLNGSSSNNNSRFKLDPSLFPALIELNKIRKSAQLPSFRPNKQLILSAKNHANYSVQHHLPAGHYENKNKYSEGFTGETPSQRISYTGYSSLYVAENVSSGQDTFNASIDGLMAAIYHRNAFLNPLYDELGMAKVSSDKERSFYVYTMGNHVYNMMCNEPAYMGFESYFLQVCHPDIKIEATSFNKIKTSILSKSPELILWPSSNSQEIPPVFYEEDPDPLPDYSISGYPISIEVNPSKLTNFSLHSFKLFHEDSGKEVANTRLLNEKNDPNKRLSAQQFALFPLERLKNNANYRVFIRYQANNRLSSYSWSFKTKELAKGTKTYTLEKGNSILYIPAGLEHFILYFPPSKDYPGFNSYHVKYSLLIKPNIHFINKNTLEVTLNALVDSHLLIKLSDEREFELQIVDEKKRVPLQEDLVVKAENKEKKLMPIAIYESKSQLLSLPQYNLNEPSLLNQNRSKKAVNLLFKRIRQTPQKISFELIGPVQDDTILKKQIGIKRLSVDGRVFHQVILQKEKLADKNVFSYRLSPSF